MVVPKICKDTGTFICRDKETFEKQSAIHSVTASLDQGQHGDLVVTFKRPKRDFYNLVFQSRKVLPR